MRIIKFCVYYPDNKSLKELLEEHIYPDGSTEYYYTKFERWVAPFAHRMSEKEAILWLKENGFW